MKTAERILMKAAIIHFFLLLLSQFIVHEFDAFSQVKRLMIYEGVTNNTFTKIVETMNEE